MPSSSHALADVTLAVLAGGEGSRMGKPKGLLEVSGRPILAYLLDRLSWPAPTMLVTAPGREKPPGAERFEREVTDPVAGEGPLRGVLTAVEACGTPLIFLTTVDMPNVGLTQAVHLFDRLGESAGVMYLRQGHVEPFPALLRTSLRPAIARRHAAGRRSVAGLVDLLATVEAEGSDETWVNLNHPEEFDAWVASCARLI